MVKNILYLIPLTSLLFLHNNISADITVQDSEAFNKMLVNQKKQIIKQASNAFVLPKHTPSVKTSSAKALSAPPAAVLKTSTTASNQSKTRTINIRKPTPTTTPQAKAATTAAQPKAVAAQSSTTAAPAAGKRPLSSQRK